MDIELDNCNLPISSKGLAMKYCINPHIEDIDFNTHNICGILYKGENSTTIGLNKLRDLKMQNFDCMHELVHYFFHEFNCVRCFCSDERPAVAQNRYLEWQANEGAAQFLAPYQIFIPLYVQLWEKHAKDVWHIDIALELSNQFNISLKTVHNRIKNLNYEIYQYKQGVPIERIKVYSNNELKRLGFDKYDANKLFCTSCLSEVHKNDSYCSICGNDFTQNDKNKFEFIILGTIKRMKGVAYMIYDGVNVDSDSKAKICPRCENEEITDGNHCKICGTYLVNECSYVEYDRNGDILDRCGQLADGNARYCSKCGNPTTFLINELLKPYKDVKNINSVKAKSDALNHLGILDIPDEDLPF